jgi:two-component system, chemotaxis family, chemotaxis protein CheY
MTTNETKICCPKLKQSVRICLLGELIVIPPSVKILVVDDMPTIRELVKNNLKTMGFKKILEAENGEQAMVVLKNNEVGSDRIQFIICDWSMPIKSGLDFLKEIRSEEKWVNLPFVMLTSESERANVTQAVMAGVSQYIVKPFAGKDFESKLTAAWEKHHK